MADTQKYRVSFRRSGARKTSGDRMFDSKDQAYQYFSQYTKKEKKDLEEEWGVGESAEVKMDKIALSDNGMEVNAETVDSMHVQEQDIIG